MRGGVLISRVLYLGAAFMEGWAVAKDEAKAVAYVTCVEVNQMRRRWRAT